VKTLSTLVLAAGLVLGACGKKDKEAPPTPAPAPTAAAGSGSAEAGSAAGSAETPPPAVAEEPIDVATEMDYEDLANSEITEATVEARLKALESDLTTQ
jgi:hypothetical protein